MSLVMNCFRSKSAAYFGSAIGFSPLLCLGCGIEGVIPGPLSRRVLRGVEGSTLADEIRWF